jgi:hypothetical protein
MHSLKLATQPPFRRVIRCLAPLIWTHCRVAAYLPTAFEIPVEGSSLHIYTSSPGLYYLFENTKKRGFKTPWFQMIRLWASKHNVKWSMEQDFCTPHCVSDGSKDGGEIKEEDGSELGTLIYSCVLVFWISQVWSGALSLKTLVSYTDRHINLCLPRRESFRTGAQTSLVFYSDSGSIPWGSPSPVACLGCVLCNKLFLFRVKYRLFGLTSHVVGLCSHLPLVNPLSHSTTFYLIWWDGKGLSLHTLYNALPLFWTWTPLIPFSAFVSCAGCIHPIIRSMGVDPHILIPGDGVLYQWRQWSRTGCLLCCAAIFHLGVLDYKGLCEMGHVEDMEGRRLVLRCQPGMHNFPPIISSNCSDWIHK